jgi:hypothetical protein
MAVLRLSIGFERAVDLCSKLRASLDAKQTELLSGRGPEHPYSFLWIKLKGTVKKF